LIEEKETTGSTPMGGDMTPFQVNRSILHVLAIVALLALVPDLGLASNGESEETANHPLSLGQAGPKAINLEVWTEKARSNEAKSGIPAVVHVKSSGKAYLTAIYLAPNGDAIVLIPNRDMPNSPILPDKEYTLFGPESQVRLKQTDIAREAKIVFYLSSTPLRLDDLRIPSGEAFMRIPGSAAKEMQTLGKILESFTKDPTFNRKVLSLMDQGKKGLRLELMGLPPDVTSTKPIGVTGAPGQKSKIPEPGRE
jgi:hypothetical protein